MAYFELANVLVAFIINRNFFDYSPINLLDTHAPENLYYSPSNFLLVLRHTINSTNNSSAAKEYLLIFISLF
jgi:hypothetical protein